MLTRQEQLEFILDHYENPRHKGPLADAEAVVEGGNPGCGDIVKVYLKMNDGHLVATFEGEGCTISQASASYLMDEVNGKTLEEVLAIDHEALMESLGKEIVQQRTRCATLSLDTLRAAIRKREREQMLKDSSTN
jgi:nitrogen fixation NifU-like protein